MASVARAIEQAASKSVSGELWWEPHTASFYALDKCGSADGAGERDGSSEGDARLVEELKAHHGWLLNTLTFFKIPNEVSRNALSSSCIDVGSHPLQIKSELRDIALQVSTHLVLDEVQAYILLCRYIESGALFPFSADRAFLQAVSGFKFLVPYLIQKSTSVFGLDRVTVLAINWLTPV